MDLKAFYTATATCSIALLLFGGTVQATTVNNNSIKAIQPRLLAQRTTPPAVTGINNRDLTPGTSITLTGTSLNNVQKISLLVINQVTESVIEIPKPEISPDNIKFTVPNYNGIPPKIILIDAKDGKRRPANTSELTLVEQPVMPMQP